MTCVCRYFVGTGSKSLLAQLTRDSDWIAKICAGLVEPGTDGTSSQEKAHGELESMLVDSAVTSLEEVEQASAVGGLMTVRPLRFHADCSLTLADFGVCLCPDAQ